jgi:hypothetical protein
MENPKRIGINEAVEAVAKSAPKVYTEILSYDYMLLLFKAGYANWNLWGGSYHFHHIVHTHGTEADKIRLTELGLGYRYAPGLSELTLSDEDHDFLRACEIEVG